MHKKSALMLFLAVGALTLDFTSALQPTAAQVTVNDGTWRDYGNTNPITSSKSSWKCGPTKEVGTYLLAQVCTVRTVDRNGVQGAVIVRNNNNSVYATYATVSLYNYSSEATPFATWYCHQSVVSAKSWSVCFGKTLSHPAVVDSSGYVNSVLLVSPGFS